MLVCVDPPLIDMEMAPCVLQDLCHLVLLSEKFE